MNRKRYLKKFDPQNRYVHKYNKNKNTNGNVVKNLVVLLVIGLLIITSSYLIYSCYRFGYKTNKYELLNTIETNVSKIMLSNNSNDKKQEKLNDIFTMFNIQATIKNISTDSIFYENKIDENKTNKEIYSVSTITTENEVYEMRCCMQYQLKLTKYEIKIFIGYLLVLLIYYFVVACML